MIHNKKIIILGAGEGQIPLIKRAKEANWYTIVVSPKGNYPGFYIADAIRYYDIADKEAILKMAKDENVSAIATDQTDIAVATVQFVAEKMKLPHILCDNIELFRKKSLMRQQCSNYGLSPIPFCVTDDKETALSFFHSLRGEKAIIKPIDSQGSRGVQIVSSSQDLAEAFNDSIHFSPSGAVIIEQYITGQEIEVDTVLKNGEVVCALIGDVYNFDLHNSFSAYIREYPTVLPFDVQEKVLKLNRSILFAFGFVTGWTHGEYIYSKSNDTVYLLEIGARGGGNFIGSDIVREMIGVSTDEMAFRTAIGDNSFYNEVSLRNWFCAYRCFYLPEGEIVSIEITNRILERPFVIAHNLSRLFIGMKTKKNTDKTSRYTIVIKEASRELLRERIIEVEKNVSIQVKTSSGPQGIIWQ